MYNYGFAADQFEAYIGSDSKIQWVYYVVMVFFI